MELSGIIAIVPVYMAVGSIMYGYVRSDPGLKIDAAYHIYYMIFWPFILFVALGIAIGLLLD